MRTAPSENKSNGDLVRRLADATGLSEAGVYKCLREGRKPRNPLICQAWDREMKKGARA